MKLLIHSNVPSPDREFFNEAFKITVAKLGISDYNHTVKLSYATHITDEPGRSAVGAFFPDTNALMDACITGKQPRVHRIQLLRRNVETMLAAFCHELVHLKQWVTGEATIKWSGSLSDPPKILFFGCYADPNIPYDNQPWEQEPHEKMYDLAQWAMLKMYERRVKGQDDGNQGSRNKNHYTY